MQALYVEIDHVFKSKYRIHNRKYLQKLLKIPNWMAWVRRPSGLVKRGRKCKRFMLR